MMYDNVDISFDPHTENVGSGLGEMETSSRRKATVDLVWRNLTFTVPQRKDKAKKKGAPTDSAPSLDGDPKKNSDSSHKTILHGISGYVRAGTMLAVMGSSGAGKTTLLNLLAGRISSKGAHASGEVLVNGEPRNYHQFKKLAAYVLQDDDMFAELTVEEQLTYAALLRLPARIPRKKKLARVSRVIQELGLSKARNTMVGNEIVRGVSGGERKRVNIGTELVTDPSLLFLDEPTTGLDAFNALNVMLSLRQLASNGRTIVSTIHQPRSTIFALFDQLCLLSEGRIMYFGPARDAVSYFAALNFHNPANFNPADFFLDLLSIDPRSAQREASTRARIKYISEKYSEQAEKAEPVVSSQDDIESGARNASPSAHHDEDERVEFKDSDYQTSWFNEFSVLCGRSVKLVFRERAANGARLGQTLFFAVLLGLIWLSNGRVDDSKGNPSAEQSLQSVVGILFFISINQSFGGVFAVIFGFPLERSVVTRERAANTYRTSSYFLSKTMTDIPKTLFFNVLFSCILYWMVGLRADAGSFFLFTIVVFLTAFVAESLATAISILTGDAQAASAIIPVFVIMALLFAGFFIEPDEIGDWISWARYLSFIFYAFNAMAKIQFENSGYYGNQILKEQFNNLSIAENIAALVAILVIFRLIAYLFLQYLRGPKFLKF